MATPEEVDHHRSESKWSLALAYDKAVFCMQLLLSMFDTGLCF